VKAGTVRYTVPRTESGYMEEFLVKTFLLQASKETGLEINEMHKHYRSQNMKQSSNITR